MPADVAVATNSAFTWPTALSYRHYLKRTSPLLRQAVTKWIHLCADTSMRTFVIVS
jgi:hypothetical protein